MGIELYEIQIKIVSDEENVQTYVSAESPPIEPVEVTEKNVLLEEVEEPAQGEETVREEEEELNEAPTIQEQELPSEGERQDLEKDVEEPLLEKEEEEDVHAFELDSSGNKNVVEASQQDTNETAALTPSSLPPDPPSWVQVVDNDGMVSY